MKNLFYPIAFALLGLTACLNNQPQGDNRQPIDQLKAYAADDTGFSFEIVDSTEYQDAKVYRIKMISGKWLDESEVLPHSWWHWVEVTIPKERDTDKALLFIGGGSADDQQWKIDSVTINQAIKTKSVIAQVTNIPYQPLHFGTNDTINRYEDDLIAYGWHQFLSNGATEDQAEWLARFPMTRAVSRAMDVVEQMTANTKLPVNEFFISGASKRGWTTWTTAAVDERVMGMAPLVIDLLNLNASFDHHYRVYGDWSPAVQDYVNYGIMDWMGSAEFDRLLAYVEPYEFKERFTMPKLIVNGTIDEFFVTDSWKFYYNELPGYKQLQYVPNGNHGLAGSYHTPNVFSFFNILAHNRPLPKWDWKVSPNGFEFTIDSSLTDYEVALWSITNSEKRDFRIWEVGQNWQKTILSKIENGKYNIEAPEAEKGYTASFIEVTFSGESSAPLVFTTGTLVLPDHYPFDAYQPENPQGTHPPAQ